MPTQKEQQFYINETKRFLESDSEIEGVAILVAKKGGEVFSIPGVKSTKGVALLALASQDLPQVLVSALDQKRKQTKQRVH